MWVNTAFGAFLLVVAGALFYRTLRHRRSIAQMELSGDERRYYQRQSQRRQWANGLIGISGGLVLSSSWVPDGLPQLLLWGSVLVLVIWVIGLAGLDFLNTAGMLRRIQAEQSAERAKLEAELIQAQQALKAANLSSGNGQQQDAD